VSEALLDEVTVNARLAVLGPPTELAFLGDGRLSVVGEARAISHVTSTG